MTIYDYFMLVMKSFHPTLIELHYIQTSKASEENMTQTIQLAGLTINENLYDFIEREALPNTGIASAHFWQNFARIISDLSDENALLLAKRDDLQAVMQLLRETELEQSFQFNNFKD